MSNPFSAIVITPGTSKRGPITASDPMPWGKHKGIPIECVPQDYLRWALANMDACRPDHEKYWPEFTVVLEGLAGPQAPQKPRPPDLRQLVDRLKEEGITLGISSGRITSSRQLPKDLVDAVSFHSVVLFKVLSIAEGPADPSSVSSEKVRWSLKRWYREMSQRYHPDRGGSDVMQSVVNECYRTLSKVLTEESIG